MIAHSLFKKLDVLRQVRAKQLHLMQDRVHASLHLPLLEGHSPQRTYGGNADYGSYFDHRQRLSKYFNSIKNAHMNNTTSDATNDFTVHGVLPSPVFVRPYPDSSSVRRQLIKMMESDKPSTNEQCTDLLHYFDGESVLHRKSLRSFRQWLEASAQCFAEAVLGVHTGGAMLLTDSWVNSTRQGGFQPPHIHTNSAVSGTYYISRSKEHPPLVFSQLRRMVGSVQPILTLAPIRSTPFNSDCALHPNEGELFLWESHLPHGYPPSQSDGRISLSMNFMPAHVFNGQYGFRVAR